MDNENEFVANNSNNANLTDTNSCFSSEMADSNINI